MQRRGVGMPLSNTTPLKYHPTSVLRCRRSLPEAQPTRSVHLGSKPLVRLFSFYDLSFFYDLAGCSVGVFS
jgi:hypothetical protein